MDLIATIFKIIANIGGIMAFIFFVAMSVKYWKEADIEEQE